MRAGQLCLIAYSKPQPEANEPTKETIHKVPHPGLLVIFLLSQRLQLFFL